MLTVVAAIVLKSCLWLSTSPAGVDLVNLRLVYEKRAHLVNPLTDYAGESYLKNQVITDGFVLSRKAVRIMDGTLDSGFDFTQNHVSTDPQLVIIGAGAQELCCNGTIGTWNPHFTWGTGARDKFLAELQTILAKGYFEQAEDLEIYMASRFWPERDEQGYVKSYKEVSIESTPTAKQFLSSWKSDGTTLQEWWAWGDE